MEHASIHDLKKSVLGRYKGSWFAVIKANIIPIVAAVITGILIMGATLTVTYMFGQISGNDINQLMYGNSTGPGGYSRPNVAMEFLFNAITMFIAVGIQYGILDWLRNAQQAPSWNTAFQTFTRKYFVSTLAIYIFQFIFELLWSFLFLIPGLIKIYSYSQAYFLYKDAEERNLSGDYEFINFITFSRRLMNGNKGRLFLLQLSLVGWYILSVASFGIGFIWFVPYKNGLYAAFYKDLVEKNGSKVLPELFK